MCISRVYSLQAQTLYSKISGKFQARTSYQFAYLTDPGTKTISIARIQREEFSFKLVKPDGLKICYLYLDNDSTRTYDNLIDKWKDLQRPKMLAIEDVTIIISEQIIDAKVYGGEYNLQVDKLKEVSRTRDFDVFLDAYPDSQLSLKLLRAYISVRKINGFEDRYDARELYNKLSNRLKDSPEGKKIYKDLGL